MHGATIKIKVLELSMRLLATLIYILHIMFYYPENCDIWQPFGPGCAA
jgi:hypothetical protein